MSGPIKAYSTEFKLASDNQKDITKSDCSGDKIALDTNICSGTVNSIPSGLFTDFIITTEDITDVASTLPAGGNLADRNAMAVTNLDTTETLYIGKSTVTADQVNGTTAGFEVGAGETFQIDITEAITLYGRAETGKTIKVKIFEVA